MAPCSCILCRDSMMGPHVPDGRHYSDYQPEYHEAEAGDNPPSNGREQRKRGPASQ